MSDRLVVIAQFSDTTEAHIARSLLESEGIRCAITDEHMTSMFGTFGGFMGGAKLRVLESDADRALEILQRQDPAGLDELDTELPDRPDQSDSIDGSDLDESAPACLRCNSRNTRGVWPLSYLLSVILIPGQTARQWQCDECGHRFRDYPDK